MPPDLVKWGHRVARRRWSAPGRGRSLQGGIDVAKPGPKRRPLEERFWAKVQKTDGCWLWTGNISPEGYGRIGELPRRTAHAHRVAYELLIGPIPDGLKLDHLCHNADLTCPGGDACLHRRCVNPNHLEAVTLRENNLRGLGLAARKSQQTHCVNGHPFDLLNTYYRPDDGTRMCRACHKERRQQRARRKREARQ